MGVMWARSVRWIRLVTGVARGNDFSRSAECVIDMSHFKMLGWFLEVVPLLTSKSTCFYLREHYWCPNDRYAMF